MKCSALILLSASALAVAQSPPISITNNNVNTNNNTNLNVNVNNGTHTAINNSSIVINNSNTTNVNITISKNIFNLFQTSEINYYSYSKDIFIAKTCATCDIVYVRKDCSCYYSVKERKVIYVQSPTTCPYVCKVKYSQSISLAPTGSKLVPYPVMNATTARSAPSASSFPVVTYAKVIPVPGAPGQSTSVFVSSGAPGATPVTIGGSSPAPTASPASSAAAAAAAAGSTSPAMATGGASVLTGPSVAAIFAAVGALAVL